MRDDDGGRLAAKLDEVRAIAEARVAKADRSDFLAVLGRIHATVAPEDIEDLNPETLYGAALALWKFGAKRDPGVARVRLYNPRMSEHGWESSHSVLELINDDMPFLVDSVTALLTERGIDIHSLAHPILDVTRDAKGKRTGLAEPGSKGAVRESMMQAQIDQIGDDAELAAVEAEVVQVLADVRAAIDGWRPMLDKLAEVTATLRTEAAASAAAMTEEVAECLEWLAQNKFTFLG